MEFVPFVASISVSRILVLPTGAASASWLVFAALTPKAWLSMRAFFPPQHALGAAGAAQVQNHDQVCRRCGLVSLCALRSSCVSQCESIESIWLCAKDFSSCASFSSCEPLCASPWFCFVAQERAARILRDLPRRGNQVSQRCFTPAGSRLLMFFVLGRCAAHRMSCCSLPLAFIPNSLILSFLVVTIAQSVRDHGFAAERRRSRFRVQCTVGLVLVSSIRPR